MVKYFLIFLLAQFSTHLTHYLINQKKWASVRSSSFSTLLFIGATYFFDFELKTTLHAVFLGSSFVGMTDLAKLNLKQLSMASLSFSILFIFLLPFLKGFGGTLGVAAFLSCLIVYKLTELNFLRMK